MIKKSSFLVPIHPPKFNSAINLVNSYLKYYANDNNLFLIFSSLSDKIAFDKEIKYPEHLKLIAPDFKDEGIINFKKIWALNFLFNNFHYNKIAVFDCDSCFIKQINYEKKFNQIIKDKTVYGSFTDKENDYICLSPLKFFTKDQQNIILNKVKRDNNFLYFWFNQIPIYKKNYFLKMYKVLNFEKNIFNLKWADFDYIIYVYFLLSQNLIEIENIITDKITMGSFLENCNLVTKNILADLIKIKPLWLPSNTNLCYLSPEELNIFKDVFIKFHL